MTASTRPHLRSIAGGSIGNLVEWFDWYVYSAFSLYFAPVIFPGESQTAQFLKTSVILWIGFLMRPLGGWLLGQLADRRGRRTALAWSVAMMGVGSVMIALTPSYASIGVGAPILLVLARMVQGLSVGGEYGTAATYLTEISPARSRGFWSSFQYVTLYGGQLLALLLVIFMHAIGLSEGQMSDWGWRVAFLVSAVMALVVFWIRRGIEETPDFVAEVVGEAQNKRARGGLRELWMHHRRNVILAFMLAIGSNVVFYTFTTYMQKYLVVTTGFPKATASLICGIATFVAILMQPPLAALSDRVGRKPLQYAFGLGALLFTVPLMTAIGAAKSPAAAFGLLLVALAMLSCASATNAVVKSEMFPVHVRALGVGLPYAVSVSLFGGSAETLALGFKSMGHESLYFFYVSAMAGVALIAAWLIPETRPKR